MNYRDFYKQEQALAGSPTLAENIDLSKIPPELLKGAEVELEHTPSKGKSLRDAAPADIKIALKTSLDHYKEDKHYYEKLAGAGIDECNASYGGWTPVPPQLGLDVPSRIRPVSIVNLVNPVAAFGGKAMGMSSRPDTAVGSVADDKEKITAAGEVDSSIAQKSVGGTVIPNKGQKQEGPNHNGCIAGTPDNSAKKSPAPGGPNSKGSINGTPKNPTFGLKGSDLIKGGFGVSTDQAKIGQFEDCGNEEEEVAIETPDEDDLDAANRREVDSMEPNMDSADMASAEDQRQSTEDLPGAEEEGEDVTIKLNEAIKNVVHEVIHEVIQEARAKKRSQAVAKPIIKSFKKAGALQREAAFISRKINEGRELTADERAVITEILIAKAVRLKEEFDAEGWQSAAEGQQAILDSWVEDIVKYRSRNDTVEDLVASITVVAEDKLGIRHINDEEISRQVEEFMAKYPAKH